MRLWRDRLFPPRTAAGFLTFRFSTCSIRGFDEYGPGDAG